MKQISGVDPETRSVESAAQFAEQSGLTNVKFEQGDGHQLKHEGTLTLMTAYCLYLTFARKREK